MILYYFNVSIGLLLVLMRKLGTVVISVLIKWMQKFTWIFQVLSLECFGKNSLMMQLMLLCKNSLLDAWESLNFFALHSFIQIMTDWWRPSIASLCVCVVLSQLKVWRTRRGLLFFTVAVQTVLMASNLANLFIFAQSSLVVTRSCCIPFTLIFTARFNTW